VFVIFVSCWNGCFRDKSVSGHSVTIRETVEAISAKLNGVIAAFEISGIKFFIQFCF
jgi:hypothetical protein